MSGIKSYFKLYLALGSLMLAGFFVAANMVQANTPHAITEVKISGRSLAAGGQINVYDFVPVVTGKTTGASTMTITLNPQGTGSAVVATITAAGDGKFTFTPGGALDAKGYILNITSRDSEGALTSFAGIVHLKQKHPNGSLIKKDDDPTVYLMEGGKKRPIPSPTAFFSRNYDWPHIAITSNDALSFYPTGSIATIRTGALIKPDNDPTVYVVQGSTIRPFSSADIFLNLGYNWDSIYTVPAAEVATYTTGSLMVDNGLHLEGTPIKISDNATVYILADVSGTLTKRGIPTEAVYLSHGYRWSDIITITQAQLDGYATGDVLSFRDGTLVMKAGNASVYFVEANKKRHFTSAEAFLGLGFSWSNIHTIPAAELDAIAAGADIK